MKQDLCECLYVDDVDQSEKEGQSVLHSGHVRQQAALRKYLHHCGEKYTEIFTFNDLFWGHLLSRDL